MVIARNREDAYRYYKTLIGDEINDYEISEIKEWHGLELRDELDSGTYRDITFLEYVKEEYDGDNFSLYVIASTCY